MLKTLNDKIKETSWKLAMPENRNYRVQQAYMDQLIFYIAMRDLYVK